MNQFVKIYPVSIVSLFGGAESSSNYNKKAPVKDEGRNLNVFTTE